MKRTAMAVLLATLSHGVLAEDKLCLTTKYDAYIDASLQWYQDLTDLTTQQYPQLAEVSEWFLTGRQHHFEFSRQALRYYLDNEPDKVATQRSVEEWLSLEQLDIKHLAERDDKLGQLANITYRDRQSAPHDDNYILRSALADILSQPALTGNALHTYHQSISQLEQRDCQ